METTIAKNGAVRDKKTGRIVAMPALDRDTARDMVRRREEKRMRLYAEGAGLATVDQSLIAKYGEDAHIVERARVMQEIATTPDAGKAAVMAAQHLDRAQGLIADKAEASEQVPDLVQSALLGLIGAVMDKVQASNVDIIEAGGEDEADG